MLILYTLLLLFGAACAALLLLVVKDWIAEKRYKQFLEQNNLKEYPTIPGRLPFLGHLLTLTTHQDRDCPVLVVYDFFKKLGHPTMQFRVPGDRHIYLTTEPELIRQFISGEKFQNGTYAKGPDLHQRFVDVFGDGIFNADGETWLWHRNLASYLFHTKNLKLAIPVFHEKAKKLFAKIEKHFANSSEPLDMQDMFMRYTLDSFAEIGFGVDLQSIDQQENQFAVAFDYLQTHVQRRGRYGRLWKLKEMIFRPVVFQQHLEYVNSFIQGILDQKRAMDPEELANRPDMLSQIVANKSNDKNTTDQALRDFVMNFLIAGRDTTATLLMWTVYCLSQNPEVEEKVVEEMNRVIGEGEQFEPDWKNQKDLGYLKMVLQETLRMYPPVPGDGYEAIREDVTEDGHHIPKGSLMGYSTFVLHRRPDLWPEPDKFDPDRFKVPPKPFSFLPFHGGPRTCMGMEMAYLEAKIMLCNLLRKYKLKTAPGFNMRLKNGLLLSSRGGMPMIVEKRT